MSQLTLIWTTLDSESAARDLAQKAISGRHAACAQIDGPITSFYEWKGEVHQDPEWRLWFKIPNHQIRQFESWLLQAHPYEVPQIVAVDATYVHGPFLDWVHSQTREDKEKKP